MAGFVGGLITVWLFGGWLVMLALGSLHHEVSDSIPALGYWSSVFVTISVRVLVGVLRTRVKWNV